MKKLAIFLAIMLIPFSAFALDTISDSDLDSVTGQAGVSIFTNSIQVTNTGTTTTYTDNNGVGGTHVQTAGGSATAAAGNFSIVTNAAVTQYFFKGYDPINIDVVDKQDLIDIIENQPIFTGSNTHVDFNSSDILGASGVMITLPNAIKIVSGGSTKTYYAGTAIPANEMIQISTNGGVTEICAAVNATFDVPASNMVNDATQWNNGVDNLRLITGTLTTPVGTGKHDDQIKIIITSHE